MVISATKVDAAYNDKRNLILVLWAQYEKHELAKN